MTTIVEYLINSIIKHKDNVFICGAGGGSDIYMAFVLNQIISKQFNDDRKFFYGTCRHGATKKEMNRLQIEYGEINENPDLTSGIFVTTQHNQLIPEKLVEIAEKNRDPTHKGVSMEEHCVGSAYIIVYPRNECNPIDPQDLGSNKLINQMKEFYIKNNIHHIYLIDTGGDILGIGTKEKQNIHAIESDIKAQVLNKRVAEELQSTGYNLTLETIIIAPCIDGQTSPDIMQQNLIDRSKENPKLIEQINIGDDFIKSLNDFTQGQDETRTSRILIAAAQTSGVELGVKPLYLEQASNSVKTRLRHDAPGQKIPLNLVLSSLIVKPEYFESVKNYGIHPNNMKIIRSGCVLNI